MTASIVSGEARSCPEDPSSPRKTCGTYGATSLLLVFTVAVVCLWRDRAQCRVDDGKRSGRQKRIRTQGPYHLQYQVYSSISSLTGHSTSSATLPTYKPSTPLNLQYYQPSFHNLQLPTMHFTTTIIGLLAAASTAFAAPTAPVDAQTETIATRGAPPPWIIKSFKRSCNSADTECWVSFGVDTQLSPVVNCSYGVKGTQASRKSTDSISCGPYAISSGWNGSFGAGNGFTTWAITNQGEHAVAWPSYADRDLVNGVAVTPDRSFAPSWF